MNAYRLSPEAEQDLRDIYRWGCRAFGEVSADKYHFGLLDHFTKIANSPLIYQAVDHLLEDCRRAVHGKNNIYYKIVDDDLNIIIIRIIGQQSLSKKR
ncbi:MAG: type II toxin-antitoxin system RelE/ParE family toxin [Robiginitomaculum sp.]|nr:type II toxin-antitoxin system RelE/ParE family toxin [Robiginitomaculum sp.]